MTPDSYNDLMLHNANGLGVHVCACVREEHLLLTPVSWLFLLIDRFKMFAVRGAGGGGSSVLLLPDIPALEIKLGALVVLLFGLTPLGMLEGCCLGPGEWSGVPALCLRPQTDVTCCCCRHAVLDIEFDWLFLLKEFSWPCVCWVCCPTTCRASTPPSAPPGSGYDEPGPSVHNSSLQVCCVRRTFVLVLEICLDLIIHKSIIAFNLAFKLWKGRLRCSVVAG